MLHMNTAVARLEVVIRARPRRVLRASRTGRWCRRPALDSSNGRGLMTDEREPRSPAAAVGAAQREMTADFEALRRTSARNLTPIESFAPAATRRPRTWE